MSEETAIDWKFKEDAEPQCSSNDFWYDLVYGGYIKPEKVLADEDQIRRLKEAISVLNSFENALEANELIQQF